LWLVRVSPCTAPGGLSGLLELKPPMYVQPTWPRASRGLPLYIYTFINTIQSFNFDGVHYPTRYHEFFLLPLLSRTHHHPTSLQGLQSPSPLFSLWLAMMPPRLLPLYNSASPTRWPPFRPSRRRPMKLTPACAPSSFSSKKNRLPPPPKRPSPRRLPCSWHQPSPCSTCRHAGYKTFALLSGAEQAVRSSLSHHNS
jgi:hypothetical protein